MNRLTLIAALCLCGCYVPPEGGDPPPAPASLSGAAEKSGRDYLAGLAEAAETVAGKAEAGEYEDARAAYDDYQTLTADALEDAMRGYELELDKTLPPKQPYDGKKYAKAFRQIRDGFRKAAK